MAPEVQVNAIVDGTHLSQVIESMKAAHPYEEVAYEVVVLGRAFSFYSVFRQSWPLAKCIKYRYLP